MISVLVPTWGRVERCDAFCASVLDTAAHPERIEILIRVAAEDPATLEYEPHDEEDGLRWFRVRGCPGYPAAIEWLQDRAEGEILFCGSDDSLFRTRGWDVKVAEVFAAVPDGLLIAYANNGLDREKCEQFFTTRRWIDTVGWLMRPEYEHFCCDQDIEALGKAVGRLQFLRGVMVEHLHKKYGKAPDDATYRRVRQDDPGLNARDLATFARLAPERAAAIARLQAALG